MKHPREVTPHLKSGDTQRAAGCVPAALRDFTWKRKQNEQGGRAEKNKMPQQSGPTSPTLSLSRSLSSLSRSHSPSPHLPSLSLFISHVVVVVVVVVVALVRPWFYHPGEGVRNRNR